MAPQVEPVVESVELGEGPHWDVDTQSLYFVDIFGNSIHKYTPGSKTHTKAVIGEYVKVKVEIILFSHGGTVQKIATLKQEVRSFIFSKQYFSA